MLRGSRRVREVLGSTFGVCLLAGCVSVGPASISNGRLAYNEVINYSEDQQLLNAIVRQRYGQTFSLLAVSSVTANIKFRADAKSEFQVWERSSKTDDLVPLALGIGYEENPTISYQPLQGEVVLKRLLSPISIEEGLIVQGMTSDLKLINRFLYRRMNSYLIPEDGPLPEAVTELQALSRGFREAGIEKFGLARGTNLSRPDYVVILSDYRPAQYASIERYLELLGIKDRVVNGERIVLPFGPYSENDPGGTIHVETRSVYDWLELAGSMIEVPAEHLQAGIVEPGGWSGPEEYRLMTIRSAHRRPKSAVVAVPFQGWWFFIDATDARSKQSFRLLKLLVSMRLNLDAVGPGVPVLTLPVG